MADRKRSRNYQDDEEDGFDRRVQGLAQSRYLTERTLLDALEASPIRISISGLNPSDVLLRFTSASCVSYSLGMLKKKGNQAVEICIFCILAKPLFRQIPNDSQRKTGWHPRIAIRADNRRPLEPGSSSKPLIWREDRFLRPPPIFLKPFPVWQ